jgi:hypothetical protein
MQEPSRTKARHGPASATHKCHTAMCINSQPRDTLPSSLWLTSKLSLPFLASYLPFKQPRPPALHYNHAHTLGASPAYLQGSSTRLIAQRRADSLVHPASAAPRRISLIYPCSPAGLREIDGEEGFLGVSFPFRCAH